MCTILILQVHNKSDILPLHFTTHRLPHYTCQPPSGHIPPSHSLTLSLTFTPKQLGPLNARLMIDILTTNPKVWIPLLYSVYTYCNLSFSINTVPPLLLNS